MRKCWTPAFSSLPTVFSILSKSIFSFWGTFILSSANAFILEHPKCLVNPTFHRARLNLSLIRICRLIWVYTASYLVCSYLVQRSLRISITLLLLFNNNSFILSQTINNRLFQTERLKTISNLMKIAEVLQKDRKHCGTRRNCSLRAISLCPTVFSKGLYCRQVKTRACLGKSLSYLKKKGRKSRKIITPFFHNVFSH